MKTTRLRRLAVASAIALLLGSVSATGASASTTIYLNPGQVGTGLANNGSCPMIDGFDAWHFVAPGTSTFVSLDVSFQDAETNPVAVAAVVLQSDPKHAYVYTLHGLNPTLISGTAEIDGSASQFVLSHTCTGIDGDAVSTTTSTVASTTTSPMVVGDGGTVSDSATVTSASGFADAVGSVHFTYCYDAAVAPTSCASGTDLGTVSLNGGADKYDGVATATSPSFTPLAAGYYLLNAAYTGDDTFATSVDNGANESFQVNAAPNPGPVNTTTTTVATPSNESPILGDGTTVTDVATVTAASGTSQPAGSVTFSYCFSETVAPTSCTLGTTLGTETLTATEADGVSTASHTWTPSAAGYYMMNASYAGNSDFNSSTDDGTNESFFIGSPTFVLRYGDIPRMIDTGSTASRSCPSSAVGGRTIGRINAAGVSVPVKSTSYPRRGVFAPAHSAKIAGVSTRHQPLNATEGTTVIGWHVRWNVGCNGTLNALVAKSVGYQFSTRAADGTVTQWEITERHLVTKGDYERDWFTLNGPRQLVLITCAGLKGGKFRKNFVIVAHPVTVG